MSKESDIIKELEQALKIVDESNIPPSPTSESPLSIMPRGDRYNSSIQSSPSTSDKYSTLPSLRKATPSEPSKAAKGFKKFKGFHFFSKKRTPEPLSTVNTVPGTDPELPHVSKSYDVLPDGTFKRSKDAEAELDIGSPDFKIKFDFDGTYKDVPEEKPFRLRREKRTGLVGGLLLAVFIICVSVVLASVAWMATTDILGFGSEDELVNVQVPAGFTLEGITDMLYESGLIRNKALFMLYADYSNAIEKITEGSYVLNKNYDYRALVQGMTARAGVRVETTVTIPEGLTIAQIFSLLEAEGVCSAEELWYAATNHDFEFHFLDSDTLGDRLRLEGFLFPDTYNFFMDSSPTSAILRMLREFNRRFTEEYVERAAELGFSVQDIINVASIIEREAGDDEERPRIAAVIYNRLNSASFPMLQIDATIHYAIAGTSIPFSLQLDSPFNTYTHEGLPPGPIANPGMPSIRAALFPDTTNEYFYALNRYGTHNFFTNFTDHNNFVHSEAYGG